jgi:hypothetical protein
MAITILQTPAQVSPAQSPIVFSVSESVNTTNTAFQYLADLYYWTGSKSASGSADYTLAKYPNASKSGIFDFGRIINSTLTDPAIANTSNIVYFKGDFYSQWQAGGVYVTGSHTTSSIYAALDGYSIFQEPIGQNITLKTPFWPMMTNGPVTQSVFMNNKGFSGVFMGTSGGTIPTKMIYSGSDGNNAQYVLTAASNTTSTEVAQYPQFPSEFGFPLLTASIDSYTIQAATNTTKLGLPIRYEITCQQKYPNVRIKWKNRFGQFDWFNFYMISTNTFNTDRKTYQPQIGSWQDSTLAYNRYDSQNLTYVSNSTEAVTVNTFWIDEDYNEIIKQLLVSDEAYWMYDESNEYYRPITITQPSITFKTNAVDKLIQYSFSFAWGQQYKLII